ncbi:MAG: ATP-binding protein [Halioglobus sp.]|nr:ATP-binding protein [Halioglobus sp.]
MSQTESLSAGELEEAFEVFSRVSIELETTYRQLEAKVAQLTEELTSARSAKLRELAEKERLALRLSALVSALPGGVLIVDRAQRIRDANPEAAQILGDPLLGECWEDVLMRTSGRRSLESTEMVLNSGRRYSVVSRTLDSVGDRVLLITDVTDIHELQEQLGRKKRLTALGEMAARLAHQIRTPLSAATLYLSQLSRPDLPAEQRRQVAGKVGQRLDNMGNLLDSMLSFVRGGTQQRELIHINRVLQDFRSTLLPHLAQSGSTVDIPSVDDTLAVLGDRDELVGALCNLAMNALEAAGEAVALELWVGALDEQRLQIRVRDDGPGISDDICDRIFDPFFTTRAQGTGLGLAVVAMTVGNHGGEISVRNHPRGGAEFLITLPIAVAAAELAQEPVAGKVVNE